MKIAVLGVGAIGGVIGAYLTRAGRDVTLMDTWPANIERIRSEGLHVAAVEEEFIVKPPPCIWARSPPPGDLSTPLCFR